MGDFSSPVIHNYHRDHVSQRWLMSTLKQYLKNEKHMLYIKRHIGKVCEVLGGQLVIL